MLQQKYRSQESAIASYDYTDLASGLGIDILYGTTTEAFDNTLSYALVTTSDAISASGTTTLAAAGKTTMDFDTSTFKLPRTVDGTAHVSFGLGANSTIAHSAAQISVVDADNSATTISLLVSGAEITAGALNSSITNLIPLSLDQTLIKKGEKLRLSVTLQQTSTGDSEIGHDTANNAQSIIIPATKGTPTIMKLLMPFKIDI